MWSNFTDSSNNVTDKLPPINNNCIVTQEAQLSLEKADRTAYVQSLVSDFQSQRESNLSEVRQFHARCVNGTLSRKLQWTLV